jgi:hypothetical protein
MERVAFLLEETGERIDCLLNPESLVLRRHAGVRVKRSPGGLASGLGMTDDPLLFTGGGTTELKLDLLFDVSLSGVSLSTEDVRDLTRPLWDLAENQRGSDGYGRPSLARFVWGKWWNILGVVASVAERLEQFSAEGLPGRSWLRMRFLRVNEPPVEEPPPAPPPESTILAPETVAPPGVPPAPLESVAYHVVVGEGAEGGEGVEGAESYGERLDQIASTYYGDPSLWRLIASFNNIDDASHVPAGTLLLIPPPGAVGAGP